MRNSTQSSVTDSIDVIDAGSTLTRTTTAIDRVWMTNGDGEWLSLRAALLLVQKGAAELQLVLLDEE